MSSRNAKPVHWVVRMNYSNRALSWAAAFGVIGSHLATRDAGLAAWVLLALQFLVYPHLVYWRARRSSDSLQAEIHNMVLDTLAMGAWLAALGFPLWFVAMLGITTCMNLSAFRGLRGLGLALVGQAIGAAAAIAWGGLRFHPETGLWTSLAAMICLAAYLLMYSQSAHARTLSLHETRMKLKQSEQALQQQIEEINGLQAKLTEQANRDPLTGLFNRRYLDATMTRELARCKREGQPLSVMMIDIDHFKQINDSCGHQAGDEVIKAIARLLNEESRGGDVVCRYGGEEFLMLLPNMPLEAARERAEYYRAAVESRRFEAGDRALAARLSIGIASYPLHASGAHALIVCADNALYEAKSAGRNRVVVHALRADSATA